MKKYGKYLIAAVAGLVFFAACDNYEADDHKFGNAVYLDVAETNEVQLTTFGNNKPTYDCALQAELTYPAGQDVIKLYNLFNNFYHCWTYTTTINSITSLQNFTHRIGFIFI